MSIEQVQAFNKESFKNEEGIEIVTTPEEAVRRIDLPETKAIFITIPSVEGKRPRLGELLKSKSERGKNELLLRIEPLISELIKNGRMIAEVRYNSVTPKHDIEVGGWHEDDPDTTYPDGWIRILITTDGDSTEFKTEKGQVVRPGTGVVSIHKGKTVHRAPAEYKGRPRTQLMVNMVFAKE